MGILPTPNHIALIRDCYVQPHSSASSSASAPPPLPQPASNALSKLTFYAVNRPTKIHKVVAHLVERATKARAAKGPKARQELGITVEIVRGLVVETGESGKEGAGELIKGAIAEEALRVAEMALGGEGGTGEETWTAKIRRGTRDPEMEARGASLFHAVATFLAAPFLGANDNIGRQYLRCLSLVSGLAQLPGPGNAESRYLALKALDGAARSEYLYATGGEYERQVEELVPALLRNCLDTDISDLRKILDSTLASEKLLHPNSVSLASRKSPSISIPVPSKLPAESALALPTILLLSRLSTVPQLLSLHAAFASFLDQHETGYLWHGASQPTVLFLARALLAAAPEGHRAPVVAWWSDQAGEIYDRDAQHRSVTLLFILKQLINPTRDAALRSEEVAVEGLSAGGILNTLAELLVRRARLSTPVGTPVALRGSPALRSAQNLPDLDPLFRPLLAVVAALARSSTLRGYPSQLDNLVSDLVDLLRALKLEEGRVERLISGMTGEEKTCAKVRLVKALQTLLAAGAPGDEPVPSTPVTASIELSPDDGVFETARQSNDVSTAEALKARPGRLSLSEGNSNGAIAAAPLPQAPLDLALGKPANGTPLAVPEPDSSFPNAAPDVQPVLRVSTPGGATSTPVRSREPSTTRADGSSPSKARRLPVAPRTFARSLFLLTEPDVRLRVEYAGALAVYIAREIPLVVNSGAENSSAAATEDLAAFWRQLFAAVFALAIGEVSLSPSPPLPAKNGGAGLSKLAQHRTRSIHSLRSQHTGSSLPDGEVEVQPTALSPPTSRGSTAPEAADYATLAMLLEAVPRVASAVLEGVPGLLALDSKAAARWEAGFEGVAGLDGPASGNDPSRAQACREIAARALQAIGRAWGLKELEGLGHEALEGLSPQVIPTDVEPSSPFAAPPSAAPAAFNASLVIDLLAADAGLQQASQLDRAGLFSVLSQPWSHEAAKVEASSAFRSPYLSSPLPSRSLLHLSGSARSRAGSRAGSTFRLASSPPPPPLSSSILGTSLHPQSVRSSGGGGGNGHSAAGSLAPSSTRARFGHVPSLADLQAGLAGSSSPSSAATSRHHMNAAAAAVRRTATVGGSARTSAAPSVVSSSVGATGGGTAGTGPGSVASGAEVGGAVGGPGAGETVGSESPRRRTERATPESVLARVGRRGRTPTGSDILSGRAHIDASAGSTPERSRATL